MAAVLDLSVLAQAHEAVARAALAVACRAEAGDIVHLHEPAHDFIQRAAVADIELLGFLIFRLRLAVAAHARP